MFVTSEKLDRRELLKLRQRAIAERQIFITDAAKPGAATWSDVSTVFNRFEAIVKEGVNDIVSRYRRSFLGPLWSMVGTIVFVAGFMILGRFLFKITDNTYVVYVTCGVVFWTFIFSTLAEGAGMYTNPATASTGFHLSFAEIPIRMMIRNLIVLLLNAPIVFGVSLFFVRWDNWTSLLFIPGLILVVSVLIPVAIVLGVFGARLRDLPPAVASLLQFGFYLSPVFWLAESIPQGAPHLILDLNPFYHMLQVVRKPFLNEIAPLEHYLILLGLSLGGWTIAVIVFARFRRRIIYWA